MTSFTMKHLSFLTLFILLLSSCSLSVRTPQRTVAFASRAVDGDTLLLENGRKVRLLCINTPEVHEPYYEEAKRYLSNLTTGKEITLEKDRSNKDQFGRLLRYVSLGNFSVNYDLVLQGYAKVDQRPPNVQYCSTFEEAQAIAQQERRGIWSLQS